VKNVLRRVALVVGGSAGMMAAIAAADAGARVVLIDQMKRPGVKLLATGSRARPSIGANDSVNGRERAASECRG